MIEVQSYRTNGGPEVLLWEGPVSSRHALVSMCYFELGYGGQITSIREYDDVVVLEVRTRIFACNDRVVFKGKKEEMLPLLRAAEAYLATIKESCTHPAVVDAALKATGGNALLVTTLGMWMAATPSSKLAFMVGIGLDEEQMTIAARIPFKKMVDEYDQMEDAV